MLGPRAASVQCPVRGRQVQGYLCFVLVVPQPASSPGKGLDRTLRVQICALIPRTKMYYCLRPFLCFYDTFCSFFALLYLTITTGFALVSLLGAGSGVNALDGSQRCLYFDSRLKQVLFTLLW